MEKSINLQEFNFSTISYEKTETDKHLLKDYYNDLSYIDKSSSKIKITDLGYMFNGCSSLTSITGISKWDTSNISIMLELFRECSVLISLPDISDWNTINVTDMGGMFRECISLKSLPDLSEWIIRNVTDMSYMFYECKSLISLPDISKWNTSEVNIL